MYINLKYNVYARKTRTREHFLSQIRRSHLRFRQTDSGLQGEGRAVLSLQISLQISLRHRYEGRPILERHYRADHDTNHHAMRRVSVSTLEDCVEPIKPMHVDGSSQQNKTIFFSFYYTFWDYTRPSGCELYVLDLGMYIHIWNENRNRILVKTQIFFFHSIKQLISHSSCYCQIVYIFYYYRNLSPNRYLYNEKKCHKFLKHLVYNFFIHIYVSLKSSDCNLVTVASEWERETVCMLVYVCMYVHTYIQTYPWMHIEGYRE